MTGLVSYTMNKKFFLYFADFRQVAIMSNFADLVQVKIIGHFAGFGQVKIMSHF